MDDSLQLNCKSKPWNKGKLIGQKLPLKQREIWQIRAKLEYERNERELAMFDLAIDSKLRACDLMALRVRDVMRGDQITGRTVVLQRKTLRPAVLRSPTSRAKRSTPGSGTPIFRSTTSYSPAGARKPLTYLHASTRGSSAGG